MQNVTVMSKNGIVELRWIRPGSDMQSLIQRPVVIIIEHLSPLNVPARAV